MEIKTSEIQSLTPIIITNYEELKKELTEKTDFYKNMVYSEENIKEAKTDRANLNKLEKAINDEKIRIKNIFLKPHEDFESKCKELMALVKDASTNIDNQIKAFESKQDEEKKAMIKDIFDSYVGEFKELINFNVIFDSKWLNKTCSYKKIEEDINHIMTKTKLDMETVNGQIEDPILNKQVKDYYFQHINDASVLSLALNEGNRIKEASKKIDEVQKQATKSNENLIPTEKTNDQQNEQKQTFDFRVTVTREQMLKLRQFLLENNIEFKPVPKN